MISASFLTRATVTSTFSHMPLVTAVVYNTVDMLLCGMTYKYFQSRAAHVLEKEDKQFSYIFYSRCFGCIGGMAATYLLCENPIHPLFAVGINAASCLACFIALNFESPAQCLNLQKGLEYHLWV